MCIINPALIDDLKAYLGSQTDARVMECFGISWNTWLKVRSGRPVKLSLGIRMRDRLVRDADRVAPFRVTFPCQHTQGAVDRSAIMAFFLIQVGRTPHARVPFDASCAHSR